MLATNLIHWRMKHHLRKLDAQTCAFSFTGALRSHLADGGHAGYLREAYHRDPYPSQHLVTEAFENDEGATIAAVTLREL